MAPKRHYLFEQLHFIDLSDYLLSETLFVDSEPIT